MDTYNVHDVVENVAEDLIEQDIIVVNILDYT